MGKKYPNTVLVGMQIGISITQNSMKTPQMYHMTQLSQPWEYGQRTLNPCVKVIHMHSPWLQQLKSHQLKHEINWNVIKENMVYIPYTMEYYPAIKKDDILKRVAK